MSHAHDHDHEHDHADEHDHDHGGSPLAEMDLRVRALESLLVDKGYLDPKALDVLIETYEKQVGPHNGARVVAKAGRTGLPAMAAGGRHRGHRLARLQRPPGRAHAGAGEHARGAQHGGLHPLLVLPVAGARPAAGLVQVGALPLARRHRSARRTRRFGVSLPADTEVRVWDSPPNCATVLPMRPGHRGLGPGGTGRLVTRDAMIGTGVALAPSSIATQAPGARP